MGPRSRPEHARSQDTGPHPCRQTGRGGPAGLAPASLLRSPAVRGQRGSGRHSLCNEDTSLFLVI